MASATPAAGTPACLLTAMTSAADSASKMQIARPAWGEEKSSPVFDVAAGLGGVAGCVGGGVLGGGVLIPGHPGQVAEHEERGH